MKKIIVGLTALFLLQVSPVAFPSCRHNCPPPVTPPPIVVPPQEPPVTNVTVNDNHKTRDMLLGVALGALGAYLLIEFGPNAKPPEFGLKVKEVEK